MEITMDTKLRIGALACALAAIYGCSSLPDRVETLEQARSEVRTLEQDSLASEAASRQLGAAHEAIQEADKAYQDGEKLELVEHYAYVAQRNADIAEQRIAQAHAKQQIASGEADRNRVLLESREREAVALEERNRAAELRNEELTSRADALQGQADDAAARSAELEATLADLQAEKTERGLVLTLGDVLFDTAQATLKAGADRTIDRLAAFMGEYPDRQVAIEGHTDSRGSDEYNRDLSKRRADAVRDALVDRGIQSQRIRSVGLGEAYPVAGNDSTGGMQQNRRVEIVISDESGKFAEGQRTAATSN
jgi:outer membrane protein OmpA-like peptidoglycan-associated protein